MWAESKVCAAACRASAEQRISQHRPDKAHGGQHDYRNRMQCVTLDHDFTAFAFDVLGELVYRCKVMKAARIVFDIDIKVDFQGCIINPMSCLR